MLYLSVSPLSNRIVYHSGGINHYFSNMCKRTVSQIGQPGAYHQLSNLFLLSISSIFSSLFLFNQLWDKRRKNTENNWDNYILLFDDRLKVWVVDRLCRLVPLLKTYMVGSKTEYWIFRLKHGHDLKLPFPLPFRTLLVFFGATFCTIPVTFGHSF